MRYFVLSVFVLFFSCTEKQEPAQRRTKLSPIESKTFDSLPKREQSRIEKYFDRSGVLMLTYVISDECQVFSDTSLSKQIAVLSFGTPVLNTTGQYEEISTKARNGWIHKIYAVRFYNGKDSLTGFVEETDLSFFAAKTTDGNLILAGFNNVEHSPLTGKILVIDSLKKISDKLIFNMTGEEEGDLVRFYSYYIEGKFTNEHASSNFRDVFSIYMYYPACGYMASEQWFNYKDGKLNFIAECLHMGDAGAAAAWSYLIFPEEKNGKPNSIFKVSRFEEYEYDETLADHKAINPDSLLVELYWDTKKGVIKVDTLYNDFNR